MNSLVLKSFLQKDSEARNARHAVQTAFETQPKFVGYGEIDLYRCTIGTTIFDLHRSLTIRTMVTTLGIIALLSLTLLLPN